MGGGPNIFPTWICLIWSVAYLAVVAFHAWSLSRVRSEGRWFHLSHILMALGMVYMYLSMAYGWRWFPRQYGVLLFTATTLTILGWLALRCAVRRPVNFLWVLALVQQAAMAYMFSPEWKAGVTWAVAAWLSLDALGWLFGLLQDDSRSGDSVVPYAIGPRPLALTIPSGPGAQVAIAAPERLVCVAGPISGAALGVMAAGMVYMLIGMQIRM